jgi:hypothetical protein
MEVHVIADALKALIRLRAEIEHHIGKEDSDFCEYALSQLAVIESAVLRVKGGELDKRRVH